MLWVPLPSVNKGNDHFDLFIFVFSFCAALVSEVLKHFSRSKRQLTNQYFLFCFVSMQTIAYLFSPLSISIRVVN